MTIPITVVTGFLGSGKTTMINNVLHQTSIPKQEIAIIVNEFGETGIDHQLILDVDEEVVQLNNGCICCTLRKDIADTLMGIYNVFQKNNYPLSQVIIETTGLADPLPIIQTINSTPPIGTYFHIDSILTVVDCLNYQTVIKRYDEAKQQIMLADRLILTKTDKSLARNIKKIKHELRNINPVADFCQYQSANNLKEEDFFNLALFKPTIEQLDSLTESKQPHHHHNDDFSSVTLKTDKYLTKIQLENWLNSLIIYHSDELYRYKGIIHIKEQNKPLILQGVNIHYELTNHNDMTDSTTTTIVLIGKKLQKEAIIASFDSVINNT